MKDSDFKRDVIAKLDEVQKLHGVDPRVTKLLDAVRHRLNIGYQVVLSAPWPSYETAPPHMRWLVGDADLGFEDLKKHGLITPQQSVALLHAFDASGVFAVHGGSMYRLTNNTIEAVTDSDADPEHMLPHGWEGSVLVYDNNQAVFIGKLVRTKQPRLRVTDKEVEAFKKRAADVGPGWLRLDRKGDWA